MTWSRKDDRSGKWTDKASGAAALALRERETGARTLRDAEQDAAVTRVPPVRVKPAAVRPCNLLDPACEPTEAQMRQLLRQAGDAARRRAAAEPDLAAQVLRNIEILSQSR